MARLVVPVKDVAAGYPATPVTADSLDFTFTNAGGAFADGAGFAHSGRELLLVKGGAGAQTVTISSVVDDKNRKGDITTYAVGIGEFVVLPVFPVAGWRQPDGQLYFAASATDVAFAVLRLPALS